MAGDRKGIEDRTRVWNEIIMDRSREVEECAEILGKVTKGKLHIYAYADNHYAGYATARVGRWESHSVVVDYRLVIGLLALEY